MSDESDERDATWGVADVLVATVCVLGMIFGSLMFLAIVFH